MFCSCWENVLKCKILVNKKNTQAYNAITGLSNGKLREGSDLPSVFQNPVIFFFQFPPFLVYVLVYCIYICRNR